MKILSINTTAGRGGAARVCLELHRLFLGAGHRSAVLVGREDRGLEHVQVIEHDRYRNYWGRVWMGFSRKLMSYSGQIRGAQRVSEKWLPRVADPKKFFSWYTGREDFSFPGTRHLLRQAPVKPDILLLHNLHGQYFDLSELVALSQEIPTVVVLHDAWLFAGHCAHSFDCDRWKTGCGDCPGLDIPPTIRRDATAYNWRRKRDIYRKSRLSVVTPTKWLTDKGRASILATESNTIRTVRHGIDTSTYKPGGKRDARQQLGWPQTAKIVLFAANGIKKNIWKDYETLTRSIKFLSEGAAHKNLRFYAVGETDQNLSAELNGVTLLPYQDSMTTCYQAADVYIHAARAEACGLTILEALACGLPVVATAVGGIPDSILEGKTGFLVPSGDSATMAKRVGCLLDSPELLRQMSLAARMDVMDRFSAASMVKNYLELFEGLLGVSV